MSAAPGKRAGSRWLTLFTLAWLVVWTVQLTPVQLLLPLQLDTQETAGEWVSGVVWSGLVLSVGGLAGIVAGPVAGALSDRTRSRFGRRRPWAISGSAVTSVSLVLTGWARSPIEIGAAWIGVWIGLAAASAALTAMIADQVDARRGTASAVVSSAQAVGIVLGVGAVVLLGLGVRESYLLLAAFAAIVGIGTAVLLPDPPAVPRVLRPEPAERRTTTPPPGRPTRSRLGALRDPGFAWLLAARLAVNIGNALGTALLLFFLLYGVGSPAERAEDDLLLLIVIYTVFVVVASVAAGAASDRSGRRRPLVLAAAVVQAASAVLILLWPTLVGTAVAAAVMGTGYGAFMAVSLALATDLLPGDRDNARDLGVVNVSANLGQLIGPLLGAGLVAAVGGFWLLFAVAGLFSVAGAVMSAAVPRPRGLPEPHPARR